MNYIKSCWNDESYFGLSTTDETSLVEMRIWCIKIGIVLVLHFNPWVEASAGGLLVPEGLFSPVAKYFGTCLKIRIWIKNCKEKSKSYKFISKRRIISLMHSSILRWFWLNFMALWFLIDYLRLYVPLKNFALLSALLP